MRLPLCTSWTIVLLFLERGERRNGLGCVVPQVVGELDGGVVHRATLDDDGGDTTFGSLGVVRPHAGADDAIFGEQGLVSRKHDAVLQLEPAAIQGTEQMFEGHVIAH